MARKFNRGSFLRERHARAREQRRLFQELGGTQEKRPYSDFLRNNTPLTEQIVVYEVSYQMSYSPGGAAKPSLAIGEGETFTIYALRENAVTETQIVANTQDAVRNAKSRDGNGFSVPTQDKAMTDSAFDVRVNKMRGGELVNRDVTDKVVSGLRSGKGFFVDKSKSSFTVKNKKGSKAKMDADLSTYFNT